MSTSFIKGLQVSRNSYLAPLLIVFLSACGTTPRPSGADDSSVGTAQVPTAEDPQPLLEGDIEMFETSRTAVYEGTRWVAETVDGWFGDKPFDQGGKVSRGRVGLNMLWRQDEGFDINLRFTARLEMPNAKDKGYLFIGKTNERELVSDQPGALSLEQQLIIEDRNQDDTFFAGLGYSLKDSIDLRLGLRGGFNVYAQARYRKTFNVFDYGRVHFRETIFWTADDDLGSTTAFNFDYLLTPSTEFRWLNSATISGGTDGWAWGTSVGVFKTFGFERVLSGEVLANGETGTGVGVNEYGFRTIWRQPVYKNWVIGELIFGHYWPRDEGDSERDSSWAVGTNLEMRF